MDRIYMVVGESGEYSDWRTWDVAAYFDREAAELHKKKCEEGYKAYLELEKLHDAQGTHLSIEEWDKNLWDITTESTSYSIKYSVEEILFPKHPDEYMDHVTTIREEAKFYVVSVHNIPAGRFKSKYLLIIGDNNIRSWVTEPCEATWMTREQADEWVKLLLSEPHNQHTKYMACKMGPML